jgi:hypothetical protein
MVILDMVTVKMATEIPMTPMEDGDLAVLVSTVMVPHQEQVQEPNHSSMEGLEH